MHDHHAHGDECLSFHLSPELIESLTQASAERSVRLWRSGALPPLSELVVFGELAQACAEQRTNIGLDEAGMMFVGRFIEVLDGKQRRCVEPNERNRRRAVETAMWIDANAAHEIDLEAAAQRAGFSAYHFLRLFGATIGVTPHQYLLRARLRRAARLLADGCEAITEVGLTVGFADLSNFVRTFHRAAGVSPRAFRYAARGDRKIFQERLAAFA